jgi:site-specific recombinase XerC
VLLYAGARVEECQQLQVDDIAITARTGQVRLVGKGDEARVDPLRARARERISAWMEVRGNQPGRCGLGNAAR